MVKDVGARISTPTPLTPSVPLTKLLRGQGLTTALLLLAWTTTGATPLRRAATSSTATSPASATSAASATTAASAPSATTAASSSSTAATGTSTPTTTPTTTPTPSAASTAASTAPAISSSALAPLALASAALPRGGRRRADRLETNEVGRSSRSNRGQEGGGRTPLKDGGAGVTTRGSYSDYALLYCYEGLLEEVNGESGGANREKVVPDYAEGVRETGYYVVEGGDAQQDVQQHRVWPTVREQWRQHQQQGQERHKR
ncbi:unnamed protein product [Closterium sp. NIES-65]|nr:unnamed protein product [Closterium sp. NIES-65]